jgi:hypothetical protein
VVQPPARAAPRAARRATVCTWAHSLPDWPAWTPQSRAAVRNLAACAAWVGHGRQRRRGHWGVYAPLVVGKAPLDKRPADVRRPRLAKRSLATQSPLGCCSENFPERPQRRHRIRCGSRHHLLIVLRAYHGHAPAAPSLASKGPAATGQTAIRGWPDPPVPPAEVDCPP